MYTGTAKEKVWCSPLLVLLALQFEGKLWRLTLEEMRAFSSSTRVHTAGWRATNLQFLQTSAALRRVLVSRYVKMQKRAARIFRISGLMTSLALEGLFSWRHDLLYTPSDRPEGREVFQPLIQLLCCPYDFLLDCVTFSFWNTIRELY